MACVLPGGGLDSGGHPGEDGLAWAFLACVGLSAGTRARKQNPVAQPREVLFLSEVGGA